MLSGVSNLIKDETGEERISVLRPDKPSSKNFFEFFHPSGSDEPLGSRRCVAPGEDCALLPVHKSVGFIRYYRGITSASVPIGGRAGAREAISLKKKGFLQSTGIRSSQLTGGCSREQNIFLRDCLIRFDYPRDRSPGDTPSRTRRSPAKEK